MNKRQKKKALKKRREEMDRFLVPVIQELENQLSKKSRFLFGIDLDELAKSPPFGGTLHLPSLKENNIKEDME